MHTQGSYEAARIIMGGRTTIQTEYGNKTIEGLAELIDSCTKVSKLVEASSRLLEHIEAGKDYDSVSNAESLLEDKQLWCREPRQG